MTLWNIVSAFAGSLKVMFPAASWSNWTSTTSGLAVGVAVGRLFARLERYLDDSVLAGTASLLVSFLTYILAERLHVSGVLAVVTAGLIQGPAETAAGAPFPGRNLILIVTFAVIFGTLVVQGLTLPSVIRWLAIGTDTASGREERQARKALAEAGLSRVDALAEEHVLPAHQIHSVRQEFSEPDLEEMRIGR